MGLRFRRSIKLAPGVRLNFSLGGASLSVGPRGASVTFGSRGTYLNAGIPGTGFSSRTRLDPPRGESSAPVREEPAVTKLSVAVTVSDDGYVVYTDQGSGKPLPDNLIEEAKRQAGPQLRQLVAECVDKLNARVDSLGEIYRTTPPPNNPVYTPIPFEVPPPSKPELKTADFFDGLLKSRRTTIEQENEHLKQQFQEETHAWESQRAQHERQQEGRRDLIERRVLVSRDAMEAVLTENLQQIIWPRETLVSFDISPKGNVVALDVDLPEIEDLPSKVAKKTDRGFRIGWTQMSASKLRRLYARHIHSVVFRIIGEVFATLPKCSQIVLSGFSQRPNTKTGAVEDHYLFSVLVDRRRWNEIDFGKLENVDILDALARFPLRRSMSKTGIFQPIDPIVLPSLNPGILSPEIETALRKK